ncbi:MAG: hypothetical protein KF891_22240 [Rhizobacter sp.]|nr:hypothetical protein [Rhizobacter sp.]
MNPRSTVLPPHLRADCAACVGLCCVVPPFDAVQGFGFDKPAHTPCPHLAADFRCSIHAELVDRGFRGCTVFDCHGAGQRVSQRLFPGRDWTDSPQTARQMYDAYSVMRSLHELMAMLHTAQTHVDDPRLAAQCDEIEAMCERTPVDQIFVSELRRKTMALLGEPGIAGPLRSLLRSP